MNIAKSCIYCKSVSLRRSPAVLMPFVANRALGWECFEITESYGFKDLKLGFCYPCCSTLHCEVCGGLFMDIRFGKREMHKLYHNYRGADYVSLREKYEPGYSIRHNGLSQGHENAKWIESLSSDFLPPEPAVLDWGGGDGALSPFRGKSSSVYCYDISGVSCCSGVISISASEIDARKYDLISLSHVLEHVPYPRAIIKKLMANVVSGGVIYIEVPFEDVMQSKTGGASKRHWHEHINFFSERSLELMLGSLGIGVVYLGVREQGVLGRIIYAMGTKG